MSFDAAPLIGLPWVAGARGPDSFDCWGLVRHVFQEALAISLPSLPGLDVSDTAAMARALRDGEASGDWLPLLRAEPWALVAMGQGKLFHHVGIYLPQGVTLHAVPGSGVIAQTPLSLRSHRFNRIEFYRYDLGT